MTRRISAAELKARLTEPGEIAPLDLREQAVFSEGHLLLARSLPLGRLELNLSDLLPRRSVPLVLMDGGPEDSGLAERGAEKLAGFGYSDIAVLDGGIAAWRAAGYEVFSGVNVPSKAFGEFVEQAYDTPRLEARDLHARMQAGVNMVVLDSRPFEEYRRMSIPGGIDTPGAELVYRVHDLAPDPETLVVVNCAGRTRSIIGAQSLINAGVANKVAALKDGTMGWYLAGLELAKNEDHVAPPPSVEGLAKAKAAAARVARRFGVRRIGSGELEAWRAESDRRTLYLLDVRDPAEFEAGHLPGSRPAPGGQLVQEADDYLAVLGARVVLVDDHGVRATMTASWLIQMGWREVAVLEDGLSGPLETGPHAPQVPGLEGLDVETVSAAELGAELDGGTPPVVIDLADSLAYRAGHIPGAAWALRSRLGQAAAQLADGGTLVLTSPDGRLARLAAPELAEVLPAAGIRVLEGGTAAWRPEGLALEKGMTRLLSAPDDVWYKPYDKDRDVAQRMRGLPLLGGRSGQPDRPRRRHHVRALRLGFAFVVRGEALIPTYAVADAARLTATGGAIGGIAPGIQDLRTSPCSYQGLPTGRMTS